MPLRVCSAGSKKADNGTLLSASLFISTSNRLVRSLLLNGGGVGDSSDLGATKASPMSLYLPCSVVVQREFNAYG